MKRGLKLWRLVRETAKLLLALVVGAAIAETYLRSKADQGAQGGHGCYLLDARYFDEDGTPRFLPDLELPYKSFGDRPRTRIFINSAGIRGEPLLENPSKRVVFVGDSVIFNGAVNLKESFEWILQDRLRAELNDQRIEVLNLGIPDTNITHYERVVRNKVVALKPDVVVLGLYLNDAVNVAPHPFPPTNSCVSSPFPSLLLEGLENALRFVTTITSARLSGRFDWVDDFLERKYVTDNAAWEQLLTKARLDWGSLWRRENWGPVSATLERIEQLAREHSFRLAVVIFPVSPQMEIESPPADLFLPQQYAKEAAEKLQFDLLDPLPTYRERKGAKIFIDQCHLSPEGNELFAEFLLPYLREQLTSQREAQSAMNHPRLVLGSKNIQ